MNSKAALQMAISLVLAIWLIPATASMAQSCNDRVGAGNNMGCLSQGQRDCPTGNDCCRCYCQGCTGPDYGELCVNAQLACSQASGILCGLGCY